MTDLKEAATDIKKRSVKELVEKVFENRKDEVFFSQEVAGIIEEEHGLSLHRQVNGVLNRLEEEGVLDKIGEERRKTYYGYPKVIKKLEKILY